MTGLFALLCPLTLSAQEALRYSVAGQDMAELRKRQLENQDFNVKFGSLAMRFDSRLGIEATDNVRASASDPQADLTLRPVLNMFSVWRVSQKNNLTLGLGIGYTKYLRTTDYDNLYISPDTDLSFDVYVGDFIINLHDRFDYSQDVSSDPLVSGTGSLNRFENTAGVQVTWDLNKLLVTAGYDHNTFITTDKQYEHLDHAAELFSASAGLKVSPLVLVGIEAGGGLLDYATVALNRRLQDNQHIAIGPFVSAQLSDYTSIKLGGGYVMYSLDTYGQTNLPTSLDAFYLNLSLQQRIGNLVSHTFSVNRTVQSSISSDLLDVWQIQDRASWNLFRKTGLNTTLSYEHASQNSVLGETLDRYGFGVALSRRLTEKMNASLGYQFYLKNSDDANRDYTQNRLVLDVVYTF